MTDAVKEDELGRSNKSARPADHLKHLLNIGWDAKSPLVQNYVRENGLERELREILSEMD